MTTSTPARLARRRGAARPLPARRRRRGPRQLGRGAPAALRRPAAAGSAPLVDPAPLRDVWARLEESVQAPRPGILHRGCRRLGVADHDALLLSAAPALRAGWLLGTALALAFAAVAALGGGTRGALLFLIVAPLVPVAGVAFSYGPDIDEAYEPTLAAPYSSSRLLMLRAVTILLTSVPLAALGGLLLPGSAWSAVTWLLPASAAVALTLAGSTWTSPSPRRDRRRRRLARRVGSGPTPRTRAPGAPCCPVPLCRCTSSPASRPLSSSAPAPGGWLSWGGTHDRTTDTRSP